MGETSTKWLKGKKRNPLEKLFFKSTRRKGNNLLDCYCLNLVKHKGNQQYRNRKRKELTK